jgi:hypothetical protein
MLELVMFDVSWLGANTLYMLYLEEIRSLTVGHTDAFTVKDM